MANVNVTVESGTGKNVYTGDAELVMVGPVTYAASGDTITVTDAKEIHWLSVCGKQSTGNDVFTGTAGTAYDADPGRIVFTPDNATGTGEIYALVYLDRDPS